MFNASPNVGVINPLVKVCSMDFIAKVKKKKSKLGYSKKKKYVCTSVCIHISPLKDMFKTRNIVFHLSLRIFVPVCFFSVVERSTEMIALVS